MIHTIGQIRNFIDSALEVNNNAKALCVELLNELDATTYKKAIKFDWQNEDAPNMNSSYWEEDPRDVYISKVYVNKNGDIMVNEHSYYMGEDSGMINSANDYGFDFVELLSFLLPMVEEM